jgi:glyoxylase-like metal-dependent hydrolase (beta-lactamase superfamily II)
MTTMADVAHYAFDGTPSPCFLPRTKPLLVRFAGELASRPAVDCLVPTEADGKVLIDGGITASRHRILEALNNLGKQPIKYLINTHWHFDHTDGNEWLNAEGALVMAHENTKKHLMSAVRVDDWDFEFPRPPLAAVPSESVGDEMSFKLGKSTLMLKHYPNAHTDGDISVVFGEANVHTGDLYWNGIYPLSTIQRGEESMGRSRQ